MVVTQQVRWGVVFTPEAADAFRRAEAQVQREFGRNIRVNSTYRSWDDQMLMFINWNRYVNGTGPYPGHSKAVHPSESFHVSGTALDSDDWTVPRIVAILAENGFIRNRLYVPNENHHFEYLWNYDKNRGQVSGSVSAEVLVLKNFLEEEMIDSMFAIVDNVPSWCWLNWSTGKLHAVHTQSDADWIGGYMGSVRFNWANDPLGSEKYKNKLALFKMLT